MPDPTLIDAHCHLDFEAFDQDRRQVLQRARQKNINDIVIPGTEKKYWPRIKQLCANDEELHACYGLHPYWVNQHTPADLDALDHYVAENRPVALGECGLDFRAALIKGQADKKQQLFFFEAQLDIAQHYSLPVVIHSVKATDSVIQTLKRYKDISGMIHSYSGSMEQAERLIEQNFMISISGSVTYDNAKKIRSTASQVPLSSLLLETDAPDQAGSKHKQQRNEPAFLLDTLRSIADLRDEPAEMIAAQTCDNARQLFDI